ncbi:uncharacterized protein LOC103708574 [Phoenix dactylifera]|uniref:Uncharacterized protein LOC103708574 n=1 Tax=Phoenix dactylifera TaxID=42345 RepID=A0A8B7C4R6_PHODC|nr:uncharacterized protein LOC103708574 [Phoenix dactylifera]
MCSIQTNIGCPSKGHPLLGHNGRNGRSYTSLSLSCLYASAPVEFQRKEVYPRLVYRAPKYKRCEPVCAFGGKGSSKSQDDALSMDSLKKAMEGVKREKSVQDMLKQQMQEWNFGGGGDKGNPPRGGGGGGSSGSDGDGEGAPQDESFAEIFDEIVQVVLATIGFIFVYIYMIRGEELTRLARDYIKYLFGAKKSMRLKRAMYKWHKFYESITRKEVEREDWLERAIVTTPTWWHKPKQLARLVESFYRDYRRQQEREQES